MGKRLTVEEAAILFQVALSMRTTHTHTHTHTLSLSLSLSLSLTETHMCAHM